MIQHLIRFLRAGAVSSANQEDVRIPMMTNAFLVISSITLSLFSVLNLTFFNDPTTGYVDAATAMIIFAAWIDLHRNRAVNRAISIGLSAFLIFLIYFTHTNQNNHFGLIWTIFVPVFVITLMGHKKGLVYSILFYLTVFTMAYLGIGSWDEGNWNLHSFLRFSIASAILTYIIYIYEAALEKSNQELSETRRKESDYLEKLKRLSLTDPLTGLNNRRHLDEIICHQIEMANRYHTTFSLILFDIDNFKQINDKHGHNIGDRVLIEVSAIVKESVRKTDFSARWGGEEFLILTPNSTLDQAFALAEKLRLKIETTLFPEGLSVTSSFGVAEFHEDFDEQTLIHFADVALYTAKNSGKNRVCSYKISPSIDPAVNF